jgi:hypothetical protein
MTGIEDVSAEMKDRATAVIQKGVSWNWLLVIGACMLLVVGLAEYFGGTPSPDTEYSAVRLINGDTYYGKLSGLGNKFPTMTQVFTIGPKLDTESGKENWIMLPRANEFHAPRKMILNSEQIVFVESVASASRVGQLLKRSR